MRVSEVISEWRRGGQIEAGWLTQGSRAWPFPARTTGRQLVLDRGRNPGNSYHCSSCREHEEMRLLVGNGIYRAALTVMLTYLGPDTGLQSSHPQELGLMQPEYIEGSGRLENLHVKGTWAPSICEGGKWS